MQRKLRILAGEFVIETGLFVIEVGRLIRDMGGFMLPDYERHPAFRPNDEIDRELQGMLRDEAT